jgi:hypothetical protein
MQIYQESLSQLFLAFVKNVTVRHDVLHWLGDCLVENRGDIKCSIDPIDFMKDKHVRFYDCHRQKQRMVIT